jgi:hypothetical protein
MTSPELQVKSEPGPANCTNNLAGTHKLPGEGHASLYPRLRSRGPLVRSWTRMQVLWVSPASAGHQSDDTATRSVATNYGR